MSETITIKKFEVVWNPEINMYELVHLYNLGKLANHFSLKIENDKIIANGSETYQHRLDEFVNWVATKSIKGVIHAHIGGFNESLGYEWDETGVYRLIPKIEFKRGKRI
jgi:hypothetical protein